MNEHENPNPDGLLPHELGHYILASGNLAIVEPNGDVSQIIEVDDLCNYTKEWDM